MKINLHTLFISISKILNSPFLIFNYIFIFLMFLGAQKVFSQEQPTQTIEDLIEEISANSDEELDYTTLYEDLTYYMNNPLNLNEATREDFEKLEFLDDLQITEILRYREKYGQILTIYELQLIRGFETTDIFRLLPFVTVDKIEEQQKLNFKRMMKYGSHQVFVRNQFVVQDQKGYNIPDSLILENPDKNRYLGNRMKYYVKYKYHYRDRIAWGVTMEKDPGEEFFKGTQKQGFDYYSAHLEVNDVWKFKRVVVGDHQLQFGQGLVLWTGMGFGKSSMTMNVKKKPRGIKKYSSTNENQFMRGVGGIVELGDFDIAGFVSYKKIDANISSVDSLDDADIREVSSLQITGLHSTPNEVADKHAINELVYGGNVTYRFDNLNIGATFVSYAFSAELNKNVKPYSQFDFQGNTGFNAGLDYNYIFKNINVFGEVATNKDLGLATVNGAMFPLAPQMQVSVIQRYYQKNYHAYYGGAFAEGSKPANEQGVYLGTNIFPIKHWKIAAYFDAYSFPWLKFRSNSPTHGFDYLIQADYSPTQYVSMYWKLKREIKPENLSSETELNMIYPTEVDKLSARYHLKFSVSRTITLANRIEIARYKKAETTENGYMIYQDFRYKPETLPLTLNLRYAMFDAPYNARIYAYESDILYAFSVPGYFYKGIRTYATLKYDISKNISVWLRYSQFTYSDLDVISEGSLNEIQGSTKSEIKAQMRIKF